MLFLVEPLTRSEQNTRRDHPITAPSHPATKAIATTEHNVLTHPLKTPHNYPPLTPPLSKGCRYGRIRRCDSAISRPCCRRRSPHCATRRRARPWPPYDHPRKSSRKQAPAPPPPSRHRRSRLIRHRLRRLHPRPALLRLHRLRHRPRLHRLHSRHRQYFLYSKRASPIYSSARRRSAGALCNHTTSMGSHELAGTTRRRPLFASRGLASSAPATTVLVAEPAKAVHGLRTWPRAVQGRHPYMAESRTEPAKAVHGRQSRTWAPSVHGREPYIWPPTLARSRPRLARPADGPPHLSPKPPPSLSRAVCTGRHVAAPETDHSDQSNRSQTDQEDAPVPLRLHGRKVYRTRRPILLFAAVDLDAPHLHGLHRRPRRHHERGAHDQACRARQSDESANR